MPTSSSLSRLHARVAEKAQLLVSQCRQMGVPILITSTLRTMEEQTALYAIGRTIPPLGKIVTNAKAGWSYHNYGLAFDIAVLDGTKVTYAPKVDVNRDNVWDYINVGHVGQNIGLEWGGAWHSFVDVPHFQLSFGLSIHDLLNGTRPPTS